MKSNMQVEKNENEMQLNYHEQSICKCKKSI
jgi:hypothetical protein